jgi:hypothetical protein
VLRSEGEAAEKEKVGSASSSVEGSTKSSGLLCSLVDWRVILRFFWEDVVKASCPRSSRNASSVRCNGIAEVLGGRWSSKEKTS